jgi:DNA-binding transcriptional LysR family regulator
MSNVTLRQLKAFVETYRSGKVALAAQRLHVTPGALSMLLKQLEAELQTELFSRASRRLRPTAAAEHVLAIAERVLSDVQRLQDGARKFSLLEQGRVSVAATPALMAHFLPPIIKRFRERHPGISVALDDCAPDALWSLVANDRCDLGLGTPDRRDSSVEWDVVARDRMCAIFRADDPGANQRSVRWDALRDLPFITVKRDSGIRRLIDETLLSLRIDAVPAIDVSFLDSALALTRAGLGVAILPSYFVKGSTAGAGLVVRPLVAPSVKRDILLLRKRGRALSPAAQRFREILLEEAGATPTP